MLGEEDSLNMRGINKTFFVKGVKWWLFIVLCAKVVGMVLYRNFVVFVLFCFFALVLGERVCVNDISFTYLHLRVFFSFRPFCFSFLEKDIRDRSYSPFTSVTLAGSNGACTCSFRLCDLQTP